MITIFANFQLTLPVILLVNLQFPQQQQLIWRVRPQKEQTYKKT